MHFTRLQSHSSFFVHCYKRDLEAGEEIFLNYGYCSESGDAENEDTPVTADGWQGPQWAENVPRQNDFAAATLVTLGMWHTLLAGATDTGSPEIEVNPENGTFGVCCDWPRFGAPTHQLVAKLSQRKHFGNSTKTPEKMRK